MHRLVYNDLTHVFDADITLDTWGQSKLYNKASSWLSEQGVTSEPNEEKRVAVSLQTANVHDGQLAWRTLFTLNVTLHPRARTREDFERDQEELLAVVPKEFRSFISYYAYDLGHSNGFDEVLGIVQDLVEGLKGPIRDYATTVRLG